MPLTDQNILDAIERSFFSAKPQPGVVELITIEGLTGHYRPAKSHPFINMVGMAQLTPETVTAAIAQVKDFFAEREITFGWLVSSMNTPPDLADHLQAAGFRPMVEMAGMVLRDLEREFTVNPALDVRETEPTSSVVADLFEHGYPLSAEYVEMTVAMLTETDSQVFVAYQDDTPIAVAFTNYMYDKQLAWLGGAATLPDYRGQGAYTALVAKRLAVAHAQGSEAAMLQADRSSSAPIATKLGFEELCSLTHFEAPLPA